MTLNAKYDWTHRDLCTCKARGRIETNTISTSTAVHLDFASIGLESSSCILRSNTALYRESTTSDGFLSQTKLRQGSTGSNLDLGRNDVDTSNLLCIPSKQCKKHSNSYLEIVPVMVCST